MRKVALATGLILFSVVSFAGKNGASTADDLSCPPRSQKVSDDAQASRSIYCMTSSGQKNGPYRAYSEGNLSEEGAYRDGEKTGSWIRYYPSGAISVQMNYANGKPVGDYREFHESGELKVEGRFEGGEQAGAWTLYREDGSKESLTTFRFGLPDGETKAWDESGRLTQAGNLREGLPDGEWKTWTDTSPNPSICVWSRGVRTSRCDNATSAPPASEGR